MLRPSSSEDETMITDHFINLRYAGAESPHHLALQCGELTQIAPWVAVPTATWRQWVRHKQQFAKVVAAGWSTHRAVLISQSAARLWGMWVISRKGEEVELAVPSGSVPPRRLTAKGYRYRRVKSLQESTVSIAGVRHESRPHLPRNRPATWLPRWSGSYRFCAQTTRRHHL